MRIFITLAVLVILQGCKHPLAIVGEGDIVDLNGGGFGCTLEQFRAGDPACTENNVTGRYYVNYRANPRPGWKFVRWEGPCSKKSIPPHCRLDVSSQDVSRWDAEHPDIEIPATIAVFEPSDGEHVKFQLLVENIYVEELHLTIEASGILDEGNRWQSYIRLINSVIGGINFRRALRRAPNHYLLTATTSPYPDQNHISTDLHVSVQSDELLQGDVRISVLTEAVWLYSQYPDPFPTDGPRAWDVAARMMVSDVNGDSTVDRFDLFEWNWQSDISRYLAKPKNLFSLIVALMAEESTEEIRDAVFAVVEASDTPISNAVRGESDDHTHDYTLNPLPESVLLDPELFTVTEIAHTSLPAGPVWYHGAGDTDSDGDPEIYLSGWSGTFPIPEVPLKSTFEAFEARLSGTTRLSTKSLFGRDTTDGTAFIRVDDYNRDGQPDVLITGYNEVPFAPTENILYINNGNGFDPNVFLPRMLNHEGNTGDFNGDGYPDFIAQGGNIFLNDMAGGFDHWPLSYTNAAVGPVNTGSGWAAAFGNLDADSESEVVVVDMPVWLEPNFVKFYSSSWVIDNIQFDQSNAYGDIKPLPRAFFDQHEEFQGAITTLPGNARSVSHDVQVDLLDIDNDGDSDLAIHSMIVAATGDSAGIVQFLQNDGEANFTDVTETVLHNYYIGNQGGSHEARYMDVNRDGFTDIILVENAQNDDVPHHWADGPGTLTHSYPKSWANMILINTGGGKFVVTFWDGFHELTLREESIFKSYGAEFEPYSLIDERYFPYLLKDGRLGFITIGYSADQQVFFFDARARHLIYTGPKGNDPALRGASGYNEYYYLTENHDVLEQVKNGKYQDGLAHFLAKGRQEGRRGYAPGAKVK